KMRGLRFAKFLLFAAAMASLLGFVVMRLWNWLTPALFGWHMISFWQALGILLLSKILFGGFRGFRGRPGMPQWRQRMMERWEKMTPEERDKFVAGMRGRRCGPLAPPAATTSDAKP